MFESSETVLNMICIYAATGFCLAVVYNVLRFFRLSFPKMKKAAVVSDFLFAVTAGFVLFVMSVDNGTGFFRLYYVISAAFGFALNMVTAGTIVPPSARLAEKFFAWTGKKMRKLISVPVRFVCDKSTYIAGKMQKYLSEIDEKRKTHLKNRREMMYNIKDNKIGEVYPEGGENRYVIKAKVRKVI
ncbi:MAG: spore cortex biosynthesis protein YabQ [Ruminiclostridium sp.]|nr:spore cortex biosynthesis protein YabQ [Ruminiclostridium sp.]